MLLTFLHIIPSIFSAQDDLSVSDDMEKGVINSIKIEGVKGEGDYNYDLSGNKSDNKWDLSHSTATGSYTVSFAGDEGKVEGKRALTGVANDNKVLMMIPQKLDGGANVTINFTPTGGTDIKKASFCLDGTTWDPGRHITYVLSTTKMLNLNMGTISYPDGWNSVNNIKSSYTDRDTIGMYVVDKYNKVREENLKFTYDGSQWTVDPEKKFKGSPQYNYFVYYPYQSGGLPGAPAKNASNINVTSAASFFADAIKKWGMSLKTDQGDDGKFNSCDLQIGKADDLGESGTTIIFRSMTHAMGLAVLNRESKSLDHFYKLNGYEDYTWSNGSVPTTANGTISSGQKLFSTIATQGIMVVAPNSTVTFTNASTGSKDEWNTKSVPIKINEGNKVYSGEAKLKRQHYDETIYPMEVGDIYYDNGGITKPSKDEIAAARKNGLTTIGIIGYLGNDYWTEKGVSGKGGHALVMCLKTIGSTGSTVDAQEDFKKNGNNGAKVTAYIGTRYAWCSSGSDTGRRPFVDSKDLIVNSYNQSCGSGYTETDALIKKWGSDAAAAYQAKNYNMLPANSTKCTGWFLPTAGQYYAVMSQLGGGISPDTWEITAFFGNMTTVTKNINDKLMKVGDLNYTEFFGAVNTWAWTSSEFSSPYAVLVDSGVDDLNVSGSVRFGSGYGFYPKTFQIPVRPFLAF